MSRLRLVAGGLLGLLCVPLARDAVRPPGVLGHGPGLLADVLLWGLLGGLGAVCLRAAPRRGAVVLALLLGVVLRGVAVPDKAPLSDDLYRYAWDGRVQAAGVDPYRYPPDAPALAGLRDPQWLWPTGPDGAPHPLLNRPDVRTVYPPAAELWFLGLHLSGATHGRDRGLAQVGVAVDLAALALLHRLLRGAGRDPRVLAAWALSPLPVLETVANAHVDGLALLAVLGALAALHARRSGSAGGLLGLAVLLKLYPAVLMPVLLLGERRERRERRRAAAVFCGVVAAGYLPHLLAVGPHVLGYLVGYLQEEKYGTGARFRLLGLTGLAGPVLPVLAALLLGGVAVLVLRRRPDPAVGAVWLLGALLLLTTPVQPWYAVTLGGVAVAAARPAWLAVGLAGYPGYVATLLHLHRPVVTTVSYLAAVALLMGTGLWRRAQRERAAAARSGSSANAAIPASNAVPGA